MRFQVGPGVEEIDGPWRGPERKWTLRAELLANSKLTTGYGVAHYNARSVATLSYIAQLYPVPDTFAKKDHSSIQKVCHYSNNNFPANA